MNKITLFTFVLLACGKCFSQDIYSTFHGHVLISGEFNDSAYIAESHNLEINYDNKNKSIFGKTNLKSIISGIPYLDSLLINSENIITITGSIPVDFLTWEHNQYNVDVLLEINVNGKITKTISKMKFTHFDKLTIYTCIMEAIFTLDLADLIVDLPNNLNSKIYVQFLQLILRRANQ